MVDRHCRDGGLALVLEKGELGESIVLRQGKRSMQVAFTHLLPATFGGKARFNVANAMAAAGACFAGGAHLHDIRAGLRTFSTSYHLAPGRLNHIDVNGVNVFVDYAHNPAGLEALGEFIAAYTDGLDASRTELHKRRRIGVIGTAGDRRDADILELGRTGARHFDLCVVKEDLKLRGRQPGEVAALLEQGVREAMAEGARAKEVRARAAGDRRRALGRRAGERRRRGGHLRRPDGLGLHRARGPRPLSDARVAPGSASGRRCLDLGADRLRIVGDRPRSSRAARRMLPGPGGSSSR